MIKSPKKIIFYGCFVSDNRKKMIAKVHIAKAELGMADDAYRALLVRVGGADSCAKLDDSALDKVLAEMRGKGFAAKSAGNRPPRRASADAMVRKIEALILDNGWSWNYAHGTAKRMFGIDRVQWLSDQNMHKLVSALQIAANRKKKG